MSARLIPSLRIAEQDAGARGHVGLFITLTLPSRFHPVRIAGGGAESNGSFGGATPREGQVWLRDKWNKTRAALARQGVRMYGLRVAEPHHDATPHWHALIWAEDEAGAQAIEQRIRHYWLSDDGDERGAAENRINVKRMAKGGMAGHAAKCLEKAQDHRLQVWCSTWGIRPWYVFGIPAHEGSGR